MFVLEPKLHFLLDVPLYVIFLNVNFSLGSFDWNVFFWWAADWSRVYELTALIGPTPIIVDPQPLVFKLNVERVLCFQKPVDEVHTSALPTIPSRQ